MNSEKIVFLHLSDIHFKHKISGSVYDLDKDLRNELERDASIVKEKLGIVHGILVTGDIAFAGKVEEYEEARKWLEKLCLKLDCPIENVWTCPGNHDVDRESIQHSQIIQKSHRDLRSVNLTDLDLEIIKYYKEDHEAREILYRPINKYNDFASLFGCSINSENPYWEHDFHLNDGSILRLWGLNSTLVSDELDDDGGNKLILGSFQSTLLRHNGVEYITLCHHPPQWLRDQDLTELNLDARARIQLFGHKHAQRMVKINEIVRITAGATHPDRREPNWQPRYNFLSIHISGEAEDRKLIVDVYPRIWSTERVFCGEYNLAGSEFTSFSLSIGAWIAPSYPEVQVPEPLTPQASDAGKQMIEEKVTPVQGDKIINPARRLAYRFLSLPYHVRIGIAQKLGLLQDDDRGVPEAELFKRFFRRAKEKQILSRLWDEVENSHVNGRVLENPFLGK